MVANARLQMLKNAEKNASGPGLNLHSLCIRLLHKPLVYVEVQLGSH